MNRKSGEKQHRKEMNSFFLSVSVRLLTPPGQKKRHMLSSCHWVEAVSLLIKTNAETKSNFNSNRIDSSVLLCSLSFTLFIQDDLQSK